jgi:hypothetical protein
VDGAFRAGVRVGVWPVRVRHETLLLLLLLSLLLLLPPLLLPRIAYNPCFLPHLTQTNFTGGYP